MNQQYPPVNRNQDHYQDAENDEIDIRELISIIWAGKWIVLSFTVIFAIVSVTVSLLLTDVYKAEATLAPTETRTSSSPLAGQLGGAAALIGIDLGGVGSDSRVNNAIAVMNSRQFISRFVEKYNILVPLFAGRWDSLSRKSIIDGTKYDETTSQWLLPNGQPSELEAYRAFSEILTVNQDRSNGLVTVAITWHDPSLASQWVNLFVREINSEVKEADLAEATDSIAYLRRQLEATPLVEMQRVFYDLIESQTRVSMLADVRDEYVFQIIDPAVIPDQKTAPRRSVIVIVSTITGAMLSLLFVLIKRAFRKEKYITD